MNKKSHFYSRKRVLVICERFYPEEFIINDLVTELMNRGLECDVLTQVPSYPYGKVSAYPGYKNKLFSISFWNNIRIYRVKTVQGYRDNKFKKILNYLHFAIACSIVLLFIGRKYDRIFVFHSGPLTVAVPAFIGKKIFRMNNTIWSLDLWPDTIYMYGFKPSRLNKAILDWFVRMIYNQFDSVYCSSPAFSARLGHYIKGPIHTLLQWPQVSAGRTSKELPTLQPGYFHFTFTGNIAWTQNLENVILGFSLAQKDHPAMMLNIFGDGSNLENLKRLTREKNISHVVFWGRKPADDMPGIFDQSQVLLLSLQPDPVYELYIPFKFSTYLAFHKPIFGVIRGIVNDLIRNSKIGITADPSSPEEIKKGFIQFAMTDVDQLRDYGTRSSKLLEDEFDRERNITTLFNNLTK